MCRGLNDTEKARLFDKFCSALQLEVEDKIHDWLKENPYNEIDDDDGLVMRRHYPPTTRRDAIEHLCEDLLDDIDGTTLYGFVNFLFAHIFDTTLAKNEYQELLTAIREKGK